MDNSAPAPNGVKDEASKYSHLDPATHSPSTLAIHADDHLNTRLADVAPPIHVSTTYRYAADPGLLSPVTSPGAVRPPPTRLREESRR
jgi:cystathionine gamma-synthase